MTDRQEPQPIETAVSGPQGAQQPADYTQGVGTRERAADGRTEPPAIRQLRAERDLLARTVAVYTRRPVSDVLAETREALAETETN
ncbi:hypothetical protein [Streptomyces nigrescens]|uniref:Uncharacterized protein n=1 Tax=Streptomyces nigrescens TaxID=1920 RepID=A0A640T8N6_STRNI|nr:hypothetical protein [Streptomyces libani]WAT94960.1 hypothetical protein STRLI_000632 [Streptomyces libani subsp. libani]GFE20109.1 hypothetical protein Sliba_05620 [Streptomyces libani subsp. libani]GFE20112.1 hypothetical protein Sliba_05650 [Streptomyces libani subsp. libani]GFE20115.1 hypothetical protein Sliba_05680 [Streptomyces libani subsp. libani]GFE20118.1 hypothetical protein Sliba_05710 [Streptomyces libani subsp. libani]